MAKPFEAADIAEWRQGWKIVLGAAFGSQGIDRDRTELVLIITPKIISDTVQAREVTEELRKKLPSLEGMLPLPVPRQKP